VLSLAVANGWAPPVYLVAVAVALSLSIFISAPLNRRAEAIYDEDGLRFSFAYDAHHNLAAQTDARGATSVTPTLLDSERDMELLPWITEDVFNPGYLKRSLHLMPKQGDRDPWKNVPDYYKERELLPKVDLDEPQLVYSAGPEKAVASA